MFQFKFRNRRNNNSFSLQNKKRINYSNNLIGNSRPNTKTFFRKSMFNGFTHSIFSFNKFRTNLKQVETIQRKQQELQYLENLKQKRIQMEKERIEALENEKKMEIERIEVNRAESHRLQEEMMIKARRDEFERLQMQRIEHKRQERKRIDEIQKLKQRQKVERENKEREAFKSKFFSFKNDLTGKYKMKTLVVDDFTSYYYNFNQIFKLDFENFTSIQLPQPPHKIWEVSFDKNKKQLTISGYPRDPNYNTWKSFTYNGEKWI